MGCDLYISIDWQHPNGHWSRLFDGPSNALARGPIAQAFGEAYADDPDSTDERTYVSREKMLETQQHPECPWRLDEPYWLREIDGAEFVRIIRDKDWQKLQHGDFADLECSAALRGFAALVESMVKDDIPIHVWCWESQ